MAIQARSSNNGPREMPDAGLQNGVCYAMVDFGLQKGSDKYPRPNYKVGFLFECDQRMATGDLAGKRFGLSTKFNNSTSNGGKKTLLEEFIKQWLGINIKPTDDLETLCVGKPCMLNIVHEPNMKNPGTFNANISSVLPLMKGLTPLLPENGPRNPGWKYPRWITKMRAEAIEKPADFPSPLDNFEGDNAALAPAGYKAPAPQQQQQQRQQYTPPTKTEEPVSIPPEWATGGAAATATAQPADTSFNFGANVPHPADEEI